MLQYMYRWEPETCHYVLGSTLKVQGGQYLKKLEKRKRISRVQCSVLHQLSIGIITKDIVDKSMEAFWRTMAASWQCSKSDAKFMNSRHYHSLITWRDHEDSHD